MDWTKTFRNVHSGENIDKFGYETEALLLGTEPVYAPIMPQLLLNENDCKKWFYNQLIMKSFV